MILASNDPLMWKAEELVQRYHDWAQTHLPSDNKRELASRIAYFAAEAREGMVPAEDVRPLVNALVVIGAFGEGPEVTTSFDEPGSAMLARTALSAEFRAKHPQLFTS